MACARRWVSRTLSTAIALGSVCIGSIARADERAVPVIVSQVRLDDWVDRIEALGTLRANESVDLTASVTETVTAIHFDDGDRVTAGKILVEMTSAEEHALLEEAQATLAEARRQFERVNALERQGTAARSLLDERRREVDTARARLVAVESRLEDRLIKAPFAGVLGLRTLSVGALVEPGDVVATLDDDAVMKLEFPVPSTYLEVLRIGLGIVAEAVAFTGREYSGEVKAIESRVDPVTRSILVRASIRNEDRSLKPGLLMRVELLKSPRRSLTVPEDALVPLGRQQFVFVVGDDDTALRREVRIGARRPGFVEVLDGLAAGERVVTHGTLKIRPGQAVSVRLVDDGTRPLHELLDAFSKARTGT